MNTSLEHVKHRMQRTQFYKQSDVQEPPRMLVAWNERIMVYKLPVNQPLTDSALVARGRIVFMQAS